MGVVIATPGFFSPINPPDNNFPWLIIIGISYNHSNPFKYIFVIDFGMDMYFGFLL